MHYIRPVGNVRQFIAQAYAALCTSVTVHHLKTKGKIKRE